MLFDLRCPHSGLPARPVSRAGRGSGQGSAQAAGGRPSLPDRATSGAKMAAELRRPPPHGASGWPSCHQQSSCDPGLPSASRWRGGDKRTWVGDRTREEKKGREASLQGQRGQGRSGKGVMAPGHPEASFTGASPNLQPASDAPGPAPAHRPRNPSGSLLLRWSERRFLGPFWVPTPRLTPPPLRFLPPDPVCTEHPGPREEPGSRHCSSLTR